MSESVQEQIFDRLFTTKAVGKGTGLGLAIARKIVVEKHRGTIEVNCRSGTRDGICDRSTDRVINSIQNHIIQNNIIKPEVAHDRV